MRLPFWGKGGGAAADAAVSILMEHSVGRGEREDGQVAVHEALRGAHRGDQEAQDGGTYRAIRLTVLRF